MRVARLCAAAAAGVGCTASVAAALSKSAVPSPTLAVAGDRNRREAKLQAPAFAWGETPVRGVNIGGWLVLEPWITPSLFEDKPEWVVDEWSYGQYITSHGGNMTEIRNHWDNWFSYSQFESIASAGLNTVRIPVGFWSIIPLDNNEPYLVGAYQYLKNAVFWASDLGLAVLIDLHGAPGGQNGFDNSGLRHAREWFSNSTNADRSVAAIKELAIEFTKAEYRGAVRSIQLLNEPNPWGDKDANVANLKHYYEAGYSAVRDRSPVGNSAWSASGMVVVLHDAFQGLEGWEEFMPAPDFQRVALDIHIYSMFDLKTLEYGYVDNLRWACGWGDALAKSNQHLWTVVGEFTTSHTDCARWLNGRGAGSRFDGTYNGTSDIAWADLCRAKTGDSSTFSGEYVEHLAKSFETQTFVYERAGGWVFWTWRTEKAAEWSMQSGLTYGWIPQPIDAKPHGTPCRFDSYIVGISDPPRWTSNVSRRQCVPARGLALGVLLMLLTMLR